MQDALCLKQMGQEKLIASAMEPRPIASKGISIIKNHEACPHDRKPAEPKLDQLTNFASVADAKMVYTSSEPTGVRRKVINTALHFIEVLKNGKPLILCNIYLGTCVDKWTFVALKQKIGANREITVHESKHKQMDFLKKNFFYSKKTFGTFIDEILGGGRQYLRSLSKDKPSGKPALIESDFPELKADFALPAELEYVVDNMHSSVLRISGPVNMWLHYDVSVSSWSLE